MHLNYLLNNPIKHGYVQNLQAYPFSSFHDLLKEQGREYLVEQFQQYPDYRTLELTGTEKDNF